MSIKQHAQSNIDINKPLDSSLQMELNLVTYAYKYPERRGDITSTINSCIFGDPETYFQTQSVGEILRMIWLTMRHKNQVTTIQ